MDLGTGLAIFGAKDLFIKILGPTADYLGSGLKEFTQARINNLNKITEKAAKHLGNEINQPGSVPPRVFKEIIENGSLNSDELSAEYYGGILASSRSSLPRDDRSVPILDLIKSLSNYQIRSHYVIYQIIRKEFTGSTLSLSAKANLFEVYIPLKVYHAAMNIEPQENFENIVTHSIYGLSAKGLIAQQFRYGSIEHLQQMVSNPDIIIEPGMIIQPTALGSEVFLWANGKPDCHINKIVDPALNVNELSEVKILQGYKKTISE